MEELWFKFKFYLMKLAHIQRRSRLQRYGFPLVLIATILPLVVFLPKEYFQLINNQTVSLLVLMYVVTLSSWYGGLGPGMLATILTGVVNVSTILRADFPSHSTTGDLVISAIYLAVGVFISVISEARYEADLQKNDFIAFTAHEIKNPLTVIKGFAGLLQKQSRRIGKSKLTRYIEAIDVQSDKLLELINDLLDVTKIEIGKFTYREELFNFDDLVKEVAHHQRVINGKNEIILSGSSNHIISGDRYRLGQVITNLLTNAIKYSPPESPVKIAIKGKKDKVIVNVRDFGIGIPPSEHKSVFHQFYRSRRSRQGMTGGVGLGLYISSQIIKYHHGRIYVKSNGNRGSSFYLEVPRNC